MTPVTHIWQEDTSIADGLIQRTAVLEAPTGSRNRLWYRVPEQYQPLVTETCDPFVLGALFRIMSYGDSLKVHGQVSPSLLQNLSEYQAIWSCWKPQDYTPVQLDADIEQEEETLLSEPRAISTFSGGVDSCFTAFRHRSGQAGRQTQNLKAGLMVHGFDIPLEDADVFQRAAERSRKMLESIGMELIPMTTNLRSLGQDWEMSFGASATSAMMVLSKGFNVALVASGKPYHKLSKVWGSHPITDPLLSKQAFQVIHDGAAFDRVQKTEQLTKWPEALEGLRVCWQGEEKDRNCGKCEKCARTILTFRVLGQELPQCFDADITDSEIASLRMSQGQIKEANVILQYARDKGISDSWVKALQTSILGSRVQNLTQKVQGRLKQWVS